MIHGQEIIIQNCSRVKGTYPSKTNKGVLSEERGWMLICKIVKKDAV